MSGTSNRKSNLLSAYPLSLNQKIKIIIICLLKSPHIREEVKFNKVD